MTSIDLKYNPYTREKVLCIGGEKQSPKVCAKLCGTNDTELSEWAGRFFETAVEMYNDSLIVYFTGIRRDYEFLEDACKRWTDKNVQIELKEKKIVDVENRLNDLKALFAQMQQETPFESLKKEEVRRLFEKATDSDFEMAVVATMSSGKSTLINAILGRELLPARNEATTANIARIHDTDGMIGFRAESFDKDGNKIAEVSELTPQKMEELNNIEDTARPASVIEIYGNIPGIDSNSIRLILSDTPGPNNSRTSEHEKHTMDLLNADYKPMIIYVLNGTQLETNDDSILLNNVANLVKSGDRQSRDRFLFVLNKADKFDPDKRESVAKKIDDAKRYLSRHGIENPRIFPTAASLAKIIRQAKNNDPALTAKEKRSIPYDVDWFVDEERMHFTNFADFLSPASFDELDRRITNAKQNNDREELALLYSGVPSIEIAITEYLSKYALPAKITEGVYSFKEKIDALNIEADEKNELAGNEKKVVKMQENLAAIKATLAKGDKAQDVKTQIRNLNIKDDITSALAQCGTQMLLSFASNVQSMRKKVHTDTARAYVQNIKMLLPKITAEFSSSVEKALDSILRVQAEKAVENYKKYVEELIGSVSYEIPPAAILGDIASMSVEEAIDAYAYEEDVKVGQHTEKKKGFGYSFLRVITLGIYKGEEVIDDYETQEFVDFYKYIDNSLFPEVEKFERETRNTATNWATKESEAFKTFFLKKLDELDEAIKQKVAEQESILADKKKMEAMIVENKRNLAWLDGFRGKLDGILNI